MNQSFVETVLEVGNEYYEDVLENYDEDYNLDESNIIIESDQTENPESVPDTESGDAEDLLRFKEKNNEDEEITKETFIKEETEGKPLNRETQP